MLRQRMVKIMIRKKTLVIMCSFHQLKLHLLRHVHSHLDTVLSQLDVNYIMMRKERQAFFKHSDWTVQSPDIPPPPAAQRQVRPVAGNWTRPLSWPIGEASRL